MHPARIPEEIVETMTRELGSYAAAGQLEQNPAPEEGGILKKAWWRFYFDDELPTSFEREIQSWDRNLTGTADYVGGYAMARKGADCYVLDEVYERIDFPRRWRE